MEENRRSDSANKKICQEMYRSLLHVLEYENNPSYRPDPAGIYDACYFVDTGEGEYPVLGIKCLEISNEVEVARQHLLFWNRNDIPISILVLPGELRVYNNYSRKSTACLLKTDAVQKAFQLFMDFKPERIATKEVWERLAELSKTNERVDQQLLLNLRNTVQQAYHDFGMSLRNAYNFMSLCIFVKYMEDRGILTERLFKDWDCLNFTEFLGKAGKKELSEFFSLLKGRFNGDLFIVSYEELPDEKQLPLFYEFFCGEDYFNEKDKQIRLFPYDFSVIPIGLISNIYETFFSMDDAIHGEKKAASTGTFYTPYYLADFIVQNCFRKYQGKIPSVFDPACGSGVFLVIAFKAQIEMLKSKKNKVTAEELCYLMENKIYGLDIHANALRITCFSLYIALLDELTPKDIMEHQFRFPNLMGNNLIEGSFFSSMADERLAEKHFNIILGNPPWKSMPNSDHIAYCRSHSIPISDAQIAQAFIVRAGDFADESTEAAFLITNSIFTNKNSVKYLQYLLEEYQIEKVINLEAVKTQLFFPCKISVLHIVLQIYKKEEVSGCLLCVSEKYSVPAASQTGICPG